MFTGLVLTSAWHETMQCRGQGCLIVFPFAAIGYGVSYLLLLPACMWSIFGSRWWGALLALLSIGLSYLALLKFMAMFDIRQAKAAWPVHTLLLLQVSSTILLVLVGAVRLLRAKSDNNLPG